MKMNPFDHGRDRPLRAKTLAPGRVRRTPLPPSRVTEILPPPVDEPTTDETDPGVEPGDGGDEG